MSKRRSFRITRVARARAGYFAGLLFAAAGIALALGLGWGLVCAGAGLIAYMVLLYDVDELPPAGPDDEGVRRR